MNNVSLLIRAGLKGGYSLRTSRVRGPPPRKKALDIVLPLYEYLCTLYEVSVLLLVLKRE